MRTKISNIRLRYNYKCNKSQILKSTITICLNFKIFDEMDISQKHNSFESRIKILNRPTHISQQVKCNMKQTHTQTKHCKKS